LSGDVEHGLHVLMDENRVGRLTAIALLLVAADNLSSRVAGQAEFETIARHLESIQDELAAELLALHQQRSAA
jgi:hypothetical protein